MNRRTLLTLLSVSALTAAAPSFAQGKDADVDLSTVPKEVKDLLAAYVAVLRGAKDLDDCAKKVVPLFGGSLVNEDGSSLRSSVKPYSLKKDFDNVKFYADPLVITRVAKLAKVTSGYGPSAITGERYKLWIGKKEGVAGLPAPTTILVPEKHPTVTGPRVVVIGSL